MKFGKPPPVNIDRQRAVRTLWNRNEPYRLIYSYDLHTMQPHHLTPSFDQGRTAPAPNVVSLAEFKRREVRELLDYLSERLAADDLAGLVIQSVDPRGEERVHMTGVYRKDPLRAASAVLQLSMKITVATGGFDQL